MDLLVLVADSDIEEALKGLLPRAGHLGIRPLGFEIKRHPHRDNGCRTDAVNFLRPFLSRYRHSLVLFDRDGCGSHLSREKIQRGLECELSRNGWEDRAKVIVIDPELEAWVWGDLAKIAAILGWDGHSSDLRDCLSERGLWRSDRPKPHDPKQAMRTAMECAPRGKRPRRSARLYRKIAHAVDIERCQDAAFNEFKVILQNWFPPEQNSSTTQGKAWGV